MSDPVEALRRALLASDAGGPPAPPSFAADQYRGIMITQAPAAATELDALVRAALESVDFPRSQALIPLAEELTPAQREVVDLIRDRADVSVYGFLVPTSAWCRRRWLGVDPGGALEAAVTREHEGVTRTEPLWRALKRDGAKANALLSTLPVAERLDALGDLVLGAYHHDWNSYTWDSLDELRDQGAEWARRYADRLCLLFAPETPRGERNGLNTLPHPIELPLFLSLVRSGIRIEPRWDWLLPVYPAGELLAPTLECVRAIPEPRRSAAIVAAIGRKLDSYAIDNALDLLPHEPSTALVRLLLDRADRSMGTLYIPPRRAVLAHLRETLGANPEIIAVLDEREASWPPIRSLVAREATMAQSQREAAAFVGDDYDGYIKRQEIVDERGARVCDALLFNDEDGPIFAPDSTDLIGTVCQGYLDCEDAIVKEELHTALKWRRAEIQPRVARP